jgi:hypothetical protein
VAVEQVEVGVAEINSQLCTAMFTIVLSEAGYTSVPYCVLHRDKERSLLHLLPHNISPFLLIPLLSPYFPL